MRERERERERDDVSVRGRKGGGACLDKKFILFLRATFSLCSNNTLGGDRAKRGTVTQHCRGSCGVLIGGVEPLSLDLWGEGEGG